MKKKKRKIINVVLHKQHIIVLLWCSFFKSSNNQFLSHQKTKIRPPILTHIEVQPKASPALKKQQS
jgi:hypothetical protein